MPRRKLTKEDKRRLKDQASIANFQFFRVDQFGEQNKNELTEKDVLRVFNDIMKENKILNPRSSI